MSWFALPTFLAAFWFSQCLPLVISSVILFIIVHFLLVGGFFFFCILDVKTRNFITVFTWSVSSLGALDMKKFFKLLECRSISFLIFTCYWRNSWICWKSNTIYLMNSHAYITILIIFLLFCPFYPYIFYFLSDCFVLLIIFWSDKLDTLRKKVRNCYKIY